MPVVYVSEQLKALLIEHRSAIKADYHNEKLFVDTAIRSKLGRMGIDTGKSDLIRHREKLNSSKKAQAARRKVLRQRAAERKRARLAEEELSAKTQTDTGTNQTQG